MKKLVSLTAALLMVAVMLIGCQPAAPTAAPTTAGATTDATVAPTEAATADASNPWAGVDLSKPATVNYYFVGAPGDDWKKITDMANTLFQKKINTTVNFVHVPFSDFQSKYALYLAGDADVDCIYGAAWCNFWDNVKAGAFKALDQDFLNKYMPLTMKGQAPASWKEVTWDGKIYAVPNNRVEVTNTGVITTQDMLDLAQMKAGDITDMEKLNAFLKKISEVGASQGIYGVNCQGAWPSDLFWFQAKNHLWDLDAGAATWMMWDYSTGKAFSVDDLMWWAEQPSYKQFCLEMADLNKAGVFPENVLQNQTFLGDNFAAGKSAIDFQAPANADNLVDSFKAKGKTLVYLDCVWDAKMKTRKGSYMGYGACFPVASKNTERMAVALDAMKFDPEIHPLLEGGIEGTHYILDTKANTHALGPDAAKYQWQSWNYWIANDSDPSLLLRGEYQTINEKYKAAVADDKLFPVKGFTFDNSKYTAQLAVIASLIQEYRFSFCFGVFRDNTAAKYDEFIKKAKDAGLDDIVKDYRAQLKAFIGG